MKFLFYLLTVFALTNCQGQTTNSKQKTTNTTNSKSSNVAVITDVKIRNDFRFPLISLTDKTIANKINTYLISSSLGDEFTVTNLKSKLLQESKNSQGLTMITFKIIVNTPTVLSLTVSSCYTGAHDNCGDAQYNFDLTTGYNFTLDQVITPSKWQDIIKLICADSKRRLLDAKNKAKKEMGSGWMEKDFLDKSYESQWQEEYNKLQYCGIQVNKDFKLSNTGIGFYFYSMGFLSMADRNYAPSAEYFYSWETLKPYLIQYSPISNLIK